MTTLASLKVKLFTDGADKAQIVEMAKLPYVAGFTTNPSLLKKAGVKDYESYARELVAAVPGKHISFEVISDEIEEMIAEARVITTFGKNVYVKLPAINTHGEPLYDAIKMLSGEGVKINVTVITTEEQAKRATAALSKGPGGCVSVFAGRLADLGIDYVPAVERDRGRSHGLSHHHGARRHLEEAAGARNQDRRGPFARRGESVPQRHAGGGAEPEGGQRAAHRRGIRRFPCKPLTSFVSAACAGTVASCPAAC
jgi:hypothetical protein